MVGGIILDTLRENTNQLGSKRKLLSNSHEHFSASANEHLFFVLNVPGLLLRD
jgi:hypothetical protein